MRNEFILKFSTTGKELNGALMLIYRRSLSPALRMEDGVAKVRLADDE
jgi:hypothetical protein